MDDGRIYFTYLDHLIREDVFSLVDQGEHLYKLNTTRLSCVIDALEAKITLVAEPTIIEGVITRSVYVAINSKGSKSLEDWERCLSALFSFLFSTYIGGSKIWPFERGKMVNHLPVVNANLDEIKRAGRDYSGLYRHMIFDLPAIVSKWACKWFDHAARPLGIYKYLETIRRAESIPVELQISLISEAFVHYFGDKYNSSAEKCIKRQHDRLIEHGGVRLDDDATVNAIWKFYGNFKHFSKGNQETTPVVITSNEERVQLSYFAQSLFQLSVLYELLEESADTFSDIYTGLVERNLILQKIYVI